MRAVSDSALRSPHASRISATAGTAVASIWAVGALLHPTSFEGENTQVLDVAAPIAWMVAAPDVTTAMREADAPRATTVTLMSSVLVALHAGLPAAIGYAALGVAFWTGSGSRHNPNEWRLA